jgi:hypothetical protein
MKGLSLKNRRRVAKAIDRLAHSIGREMSLARRVVDNQKHYCPVCNLFYCEGGHLNFYCHDCPVLCDAMKTENSQLDFSQACTKELGKPKPCSYCRPKTVKYERSLCKIANTAQWGRTMGLTSTETTTVPSKATESFSPDSNTATTVLFPGSKKSALAAVNLSSIPANVRRGRKNVVNLPLLQTASLPVSVRGKSVLYRMQRPHSLLLTDCLGGYRVITSPNF